MARPFEGHESAITSIAFSPGGTRIVSGSQDNNIRVWDLSTGKTIVVFGGHTHAVNSVAFSPNGSRIISGSFDYAIRVWEARKYDEDFTVGSTGWITRNNDILFWVSPGFHTYLPHPCNTLVIGPEGTASIDYHRLNIGESWSECYRPS
jgi:WD40 repeat protein